MHGVSDVVVGFEILNTKRIKTRKLEKKLPECLKSVFEESRRIVMTSRRQVSTSSTAKQVPSQSGLVGYWCAKFSNLVVVFFFCYDRPMTRFSVSMQVTSKRDFRGQDETSRLGNDSQFGT
jgi:hypothetical protein